MSKRGRPTKEPTAEDKAKVADLLAKKVPIEDLAKMFSLSKPTFRKYFHNEIFAGKKISGPPKPSREITEAAREKVKLYLGYGMEPEDIALVLGYVGPDEFDSFKGDYHLELRIGRAVTRAQTIDRLDKQSQAGLIGATTKLEALSRPMPTKDGPAAAVPTEYVGKKAAAKADAAAAVASGGKFAPRAAPRLVASGGKPVSE
ncbi:MAG: hypothetical protein KGJ57_17475 [Sphingomonadales bacterium]|nr:hypothetical protein [Sphingomonadales bacterium]MDE2171189.1 hypothetical protein [Sphingomonadales bacterium]